MAGDFERQQRIDGGRDLTNADECRITLGEFEGSAHDKFIFSLRVDVSTAHATVYVTEEQLRQHMRYVADALAHARLVKNGQGGLSGTDGSPGHSAYTELVATPLHGTVR